MSEQYVIKEIIKGQTVYFVRFNNTIMFGTNFKVRVMSKTLSGATLFKDTMKAEVICNELDQNFKIYPVCPICHRAYSRYPTISKKDNKTKICGRCGTNESLIIFFDHKIKKPKRI